MSCGQVGNQIIGRVLIWCCCGDGCLKVGCGSIAVCKSDLIRFGLLYLEVSTQPLGKVAKWDSRHTCELKESF